MSAAPDHRDHLIGHPGQGYFICGEHELPVWHWAEPEPPCLSLIERVAIWLALTTMGWIAIGKLALLLWSLLMN